MTDHPQNTGDPSESRQLPQKLFRASTGRFAPVSDGESVWVCDPEPPGKNGERWCSCIRRWETSGLSEHQLAWFAERGYRALAYDRRGHGSTPSGRHGLKSATRKMTCCSCWTRRESPTLCTWWAQQRRTLAADSRGPPPPCCLLDPGVSMAGIAADIYPEGTSTLLPPRFLALPVLARAGPRLPRRQPCRNTSLAGPGGAERAGKHCVRPRQVGGQTDSDGGRQPSASHSSVAGAAPAPRVSEGWLAAKPGGATEHGVPLHLITGDADPYTTPSAYARLAQALPGAAFEVVTGSGHSPYWERPDAFNTMVLHHVSAVVTQGAPA